jgi:probable F420-dependent oxidoreductase
VKWGILFASTGFPDPVSAAELGRAAEAAGFESLWAPEHVVISPDSQVGYNQNDHWERLYRRGGIPDPLMWLAFVAAHTSTIRLGTNVVVLPQHTPFVFAKTAATLDVLSGGRAELGIGVGGIAEDYAALGVRMSDRGRRMDEQIAVLRTLWSVEVASFKGEFYEFSGIRSDPKPVRGAIPLHIGGTSAAAIRRAATVGDGYFPYVPPGQHVREVLPEILGRLRDEAERSGRDPAGIEITSGGARTAEAAAGFAEQGVHRLTIAVRAQSGQELRDELQAFGETVIAPTRDL